VGDLRSRLEADLGDQPPPRGPEGLERVLLPASAVEREHQLAHEPLARRVVDHELSQLPDELRVPAGGQVGLHTRLERDDPLLLEPHDLGLSERFELQFGQGRAAPECERLTQNVRGPLGLSLVQRAAAVLDEARETLGVEILRSHPQAVTRRRRDESIGVSERFAQSRDVDLHRLHRACRCLLAPQRERQPLDMHRLVGMQEQHGQYSARLDAT
jgi:hypothetical protein